MGDRIILLGWDRPAVGREQDAMKLWRKTLEYYGKLQADGKIESFEPVILDAHGGDLNGFFLIRGDEEKLQEIRRDDHYINFMVEGRYCLEGLSAISGNIGNGAADYVARWSRLIFR